MKYKNITDIAGIAYGNIEEEIIREKITNKFNTCIKRYN